MCFLVLDILVHGVNTRLAIGKYAIALLPFKDAPALAGDR
jgi:hypothetical protein